jgi:hypothetical protein
MPIKHAETAGVFHSLRANKKTAPETKNHQSKLKFPYTLPILFTGNRQKTAAQGQNAHNCATTLSQLPYRHKFEKL